MKMPVLSGMSIIKLLSRIGFRVLDQQGSHVILIKEAGRKRLKPVVPMHKEVAIGTMLSIIKQAGMTREEFVRLYEEHR